MFKKINLLVIISSVVFSAQAFASSQAYYQQYPQYPIGQDQQQNYQQQSKGPGFGEWKSWMQNQFNGQNWQSGDGNIFQDAKGFYRLMGSGKTKWKFYFDVDFQAEMDAWIKGQGNSNTDNRWNQNQQYNQNTQQYYNQQGQVYPRYYYGGQGQYRSYNQGYGYPHSGYYYPYQR